MIKSYLVISLSLLVIVPFLVLDVDAQSPSPPPGVLEIPDNFPTNKQTNLYLSSSRDLTWKAAARVHASPGTERPGDMFIQANTKLLPNTALVTSACTNSVTDLVTDNGADPTNVPSNQLKYSIGLLFASGCTAYNNIRSEPFLTDKEIRITIYDRYNKTSYYYSLYENVTVAQPITACSSTNFNENDQTLKGSTEMCYGVNGTNMVIITKRFAGFYGAADNVTVPLLQIPTGPSSSTVDGTKIIANTSTNTAVTQDALSATDGTYRYKNRVSNSTLPPTGSITFTHPTPILSNPIFSSTVDGDIGCRAQSTSLANTFTSLKPFPTISIPNNIADRDNPIGVGIDFINFTTFETTCSPDFEAASSNPLLTSKEMIVALYNQSGKTPYFFSPRDNIASAQSIPVCTADNFNASDNTLKGDTKICYGMENRTTDPKGNHLVIVTKRLAGFYGAADTITPPANPADPDAGGVTTPDPSTPDPPTTDPPLPPSTSATLLEPNNFPSDKKYLTLTISSSEQDTTGSFSSHGRFTNGPNNRIGDIYIPATTKILSNVLFYNSVECTAAVNTLKQLTKAKVQDLAVPDNIKLKKKSKTFAMGFDFYPGNNDRQKCTPDFEDKSNYPLFTNKELRFTIYDKSNKKPYYFSPRDNITQAQPIPLCTNNNFNAADQTLKRDTKMCYGTNGNDMIIITKRLTGFYGAANNVTTPDNPIDLDKGYVSTAYILNPLPNTPDKEDLTFAISIDPPNNRDYWHSTTRPNKTLEVGGDTIGHVFVPGPRQPIESNPILPNATEYLLCSGNFHNVRHIINNTYSNNVPNLAVPSNIMPKGNDSIIAIGINWTPMEYTSNIKCDMDLEAFSKDPLIITKELRYTLYNQADKKAYYFSPRENILEAQPIDPCTSLNLHISNQTLKEDVQMCYGTYRDDLVIITKRLTGFYGAADTVTPPASRADLGNNNIFTSRNNIMGLGTNDPKAFKITTVSAGSAGIDTFGKYSYSNSSNQKGHVYIPRDTVISNDIFPAADAGKTCTLGYVISSEYVNPNNPTLYKLPDDVSEGVAYGFAYSDNTLAGSDPSSCTLRGNDIDDPLDVNNVLQIVLYDQANKQGYWYLRDANITTSQYMPPCSTSNFDDTTKTLIDTKFCYANVGDDLVIYTKVLQLYGTKYFDDDGMSAAPTFGASPLTGEQLVTCGYKMDDTCRDITAYHVDYERDIIQTNTTHTFALKALAPNMIDSFTLAFGVPEIGSPVNAAEAYITAKLAVNYSAPSYYNILNVIVHDPNNIIDYDITNTEISRVSCSGGILECTRVTFPDVLFRETLYHEPFVVMITDTLLYSSINYMNDGILVTGTPLNEQPTISPGITVDTGDIRPTKLVLVRTDKVNDLWKDAFGNTWSRNSFGNYIIVQYAPYAGTVPVCKDINDRLCAPFKAKLDWHNQRMIELRDSLYTAYTTKAYAEINNIFTYEFGDLDSRTRTLINLGWLTE